MDLLNHLHQIARETNDIIHIVCNILIVPIWEPLDPKIRVCADGCIPHAMELVFEMFMEVRAGNSETIQTVVNH